MPVLSREGFAERLATCSAADLRAFVADVWAERGYETAVDGEAVVATREGESLTLFPAVDRRFRGPTEPPHDVGPDVVVDGTDGGDGVALADAHGASYVGPEDLYERLLYGLDREVAARLLERHLDTPLHVEASATVGRRGSDEPSADGPSSVEGEGDRPRSGRGDPTAATSCPSSSSARSSSRPSSWVSDRVR